MRWFRYAAVSSLCLVASVSGAVEPAAQLVQNPYAVGPTAVLGVPVTSTAAPAPPNAWRGTVQPASLAEPLPTASEMSLPSRTLPNDCLKALRAAVQVRSPAEAYRAAELPMSSDKTAAMPPMQNHFATPRRDDAVKPATWIEDASPRAGKAPAPTTAAPQLLSDVTGAHQGATRLTHNPYRVADAAPNRSVSPAAAVNGENPLR